MEIFRKLRWGLYPLNKTFWGFYVFGGLCAFWLPIVLGALLIGVMPQIRPFVYILFFFGFWTYWAVASVGVWRTADLYKGDIGFAPKAAKLAVGLVAASVVFRLINGGAATFIGRTMGNLGLLNSPATPAAPLLRRLVELGLKAKK